MSNRANRQAATILAMIYLTKSIFDEIWKKSGDNWLKSVNKRKLTSADTQIRVCNWILYFYFSTKTYVVGSQKNCLDETVLLSTQTTCLNWWIRKYSQFYAQKFCLTGPMQVLAILTAILVGLHSKLGASWMKVTHITATNPAPSSQYTS